jgi:fucose 4-O-acetylase-like acetyltransferase
MASNGKRDTYLDSVKTALIYGVILTHCIMRLGGVKNHDSTDLIAFDFLSLILMPLFVMVSGYFSNPDKSIRKSCLGIFSAFVLFQVIWRIMSPPGSLHALLSPAPTLWYLLSLCYWRVFIHEMNKYIKKKWIWLALSLVIMIIAGFIPLSKECSFQRTFAFFPFFILGNMMRGTDGVSWVKRQNKYLCGMILLSFMIVLFFYHPYSQWLTFGFNSFYAYHCDFALAPFVKIGWFLLAVFIGTAFLCVIPDTKLLSSQGDKTLTVYLFHMFPIVFMEKMGVHIDHILISMVLAMVIYLVTNYMHSFRIVRWMTCPFK